MSTPHAAALAPDFAVSRLLDTGAVALKHVECRGACRQRGAEECAGATHLVFPYRGVYLRHVGRDQSVADANHVLFFNAGESYQVSHPVNGGDASLVLAVSQALLRELAPATMLARRDDVTFRGQSLRIDPHTQARVGLLLHALRHRGTDALRAESLALDLLRHTLGAGTPATGATHGRRRLVDRAKLLLASDLARRWSLADIAAELGGSPVYLTQAFQQVEGVPLYRYQLRLRLAHALSRVARGDDLSALAADLGFSSHSHFTAAFRQAYGASPSAFRRSARRAG